MSARSTRRVSAERLQKPYAGRDLDRQAERHGCGIGGLRSLPERMEASGLDVAETALEGRRIGRSRRRPRVPVASSTTWISFSASSALPIITSFTPSSEGALRSSSMWWLGALRRARSRAMSRALSAMPS
jgi:hypothetical protein